MIEIPTDNKLSAIEFFRVRAEAATNPKSRQSLGQAIDLFDQFLSGSSLDLNRISERLLAEWVSWLFFRGYTWSTILLYVKNLSSLFGKGVKEGLVEDTGAFPAIKDRLKKVSPSGIEINSDRDCVRKLQRLVHTKWENNPERQLAKDIVLFAIYNGGMTFERIASYRKSEYAGDDKAVLEIVNRNSKPKHKYLFPLRQSERTPAQLYRALSGLFSDALKMVGINLSLYNSATSIDLWAMAAMTCGFSASEIHGCIGESGLINPVFSFAPCEEVTEERKSEIRRYVTEVLTKDPDNWYAMQFRPHVAYELILNRLKENKLQLRDTFYPMEEIVRRVGKKMITKTRPIVSGLLFFKTKATALPELFYHIGDLAWCYRQSREVRAPYAVISQRAIEIYQQTIGKFTSDMEILPAGSIQLKEGDRVEIIGGDFIGRQAIFQKEIDKVRPSSPTSSKSAPPIESPKAPLSAPSDVRLPASKRIIYRLKLIGDNDIEWVVDVDPRLVTKVSRN